MEQVFAFLGLASAAGIGYWFWHWRRRHAERQRAAEERLATFMAQAMAAAKPQAVASAAVKPLDPAQRLLFEAAGKAGEANEPVLAIQLYARLLARFPDGPFAAQARTAVQAQKKKFVKT